MEKKKVFKIVGIVLLSIVGLFVLSLFISYLMNNVDNYSDDSYSYNKSFNTSESPALMDANRDMSLPSLDGKTAMGSRSIVENNSELSSEAPKIQNKDKNIIKEGNLKMLAEDIDNTVKEIDIIASKYQAESQNTYDRGKGKNRSVNIVYKVRVFDFEKFFSELKDMDVEFDSSSSGITDVTNEVMDLQARLKTYRNTETQLLEIQRSAKTVADTMSVYKELTNIRYEIERIESQLKNYSDKTDYSTVSISIVQNNAGAMIEDDKWKPLGVLKNALRALVAVLKSLGSLLIWLVVFGIPTVVIVFVVRYIVKKRKK